jgi:hypothetical protein
MLELDKAAMTEHSISLVHHIQLQNTSTLSTTSTHTDFIINETVLKQKYMNREDGFCTRMSS